MTDMQEKNASLNPEEIQDAVQSTENQEIVPENTKTEVEETIAASPEPAAPSDEVVDATPAPEEVAVVEEAPAAEAVPEETPEAKEETPAEVEAPVTDGGATETKEEDKSLPLTKENVLAKLQEVADNVATTSRATIDALKQQFYKLRNVEVEEEKKAFVAEGNAEEDFQPKKDSLETQLKQLLAVIKEKRSILNAQQESKREENYEVKCGIVAKLNELSESQEDPQKNYQEFKRLQQQWKETGSVPARKEKDLERDYQKSIERFYDLLKLNNEFREYDFKKNLEIKTRLCEAAEQLADEPSPVSAFYQLQKLHQQFRETGPVAKELRDSIWERFKAASSVVNRRHQQYFEEQKAQERENLEKKTAICEIVEAINYDELKTYADWNKKAQEIIALQKKWKGIGFAPQKQNVHIFERFRKACDEFFQKKSEYMKSIRSEMAGNLEKKRSLAERAEALKDSTDWKNVTDEMVKLQKEWKQVGPVARKHADALWKRFISACDSFFEAKNAATNSQHSAEQQNLKTKKEIIRKLKALAEDAKEGVEDAAESVRDLMQEWNETGHVPFRDKDKIYKQYHEIVDTLNEKLPISSIRRRVGKAGQNVQQTLYKEREKLVRNYENLKSELQTYQNNLGFLTAASKHGNTLLNQLNKKMDKLKEDIEAARQKILDFDARKEEEKPEAPESQAPAAEEPVAEAPAAEPAADEQPAEPQEASPEAE